MKIAIVGGGPAGLRAAEIAAQGGASVTVYEAKPSVGRKFLVAGRGGLNLTKAEAPELFATHYRGPEMPAEIWPSLLCELDPEGLRAWALDLGIETFAASTGRVYPTEMKAAPLLRRWVGRLRELGVRFLPRHRWTGFENGNLRRPTFLSEAGPLTAEADATILALGGGSWPETGSDGAWQETLRQLGVEVASLQPANCGWEVEWPAKVLAAAEGQPLKNIVASADGKEAKGELMVTRYGLEGGAIYQLGAALRAMEAPELEIDFKPSQTPDRLIAKLGSAKRNLLAEATQRWKLGEAARAIIASQFAPEALTTPEQVAAAAKHCPVVLRAPRPIAEAISSAGGIRWIEIDENLMLLRLPGVFVAGEMIDWEAPTGGYLMQGCFATGTRAGHGALAFRP